MWEQWRFSWYSTACAWFRGRPDSAGHQPALPGRIPCVPGNPAKLPCPYHCAYQQKYRIWRTDEPEYWCGWFCIQAIQCTGAAHIFSFLCLSVSGLLILALLWLIETPMVFIFGCGRRSALWIWKDICRTVSAFWGSGRLQTEWGWDIPVSV